MFLRITLLTFIVFYTLASFGQVEIGFQPYDVRAFSLTESDLEKGFEYSILNKEFVDSFHLKSLNFKSRTSKNGVFERSHTDRIGFMMHNSMTIDSTGCYRLELSSDDGSRLWIDSALVINNDFPHGMRSKTLEVCIPKGIYPIDIWYYNAYPLNYGLVFKVDWFGASALCDQHIQQYKAEKSMCFDDVVFFDFDRHDIRRDAMDKIDSIAQIIQDFEAAYVEIHGHTDQLGDDAYNMKLSQNRAEAIRSAIAAKVRKRIRWKAVGHGERLLLSNAMDQQSRQHNRRVEIRIKKAGSLQ